MRSAEPVGIGERLRNAREARGWSLADVAGLTRIRAVYLQALEEEQFDRLPGKTYVRGFLRTYALTLGLDPAELFTIYHLEFDAPAQPIVGVYSVEVPIRPAAPPSPLRRLIVSVGIAAFVVVLFLGLIGYQQLRRFAAPVGPSRVSPPVAEPARPSPAPVPAPAPPQEVPQERPAAAQPPPADAARPQPAPLTVVLRAAEESWIRITADGARVFEGYIRAGEQREWTAQSSLTVRIGNAPGVSVDVNGQPVQPPPGRRVWERTFTAP